MATAFVAAQFTVRGADPRPFDREKPTA